MYEHPPWQIPVAERRFVRETAENFDFTDVWQIPYNLQFRNACRGQVRGIAALWTPSPPHKSAYASDVDGIQDERDGAGDVDGRCMFLKRKWIIDVTEISRLAASDVYL